MIVSMFWGSPSQPGSLCNLREIVQRTHVDKVVKVFNVGDEFLLHKFKAHLIAGIIHKFEISSSSDAIEHVISKKWLEQQAERLVGLLLIPKKSDDPAYTDPIYHLHHAFLYVDLREAIRWENGPQIVRH